MLTHFAHLSLQRHVLVSDIRIIARIMTANGTCSKIVERPLAFRRRPKRHNAVGFAASFPSAFFPRIFPSSFFLQTASMEDINVSKFANELLIISDATARTQLG